MSEFTEEERKESKTFLYEWKRKEVKEWVREIDPELQKEIKDLPPKPLEKIFESLPKNKPEWDFSDLIAVHVTNTFPEEGRIKTRLEYDPEFYVDRVDFSLNQPVGVMGGAPFSDFRERKYAILVPFTLIKERIENLVPSNTFIMGGVELPSGSVVIGDLNNLRIYLARSKVREIEKNADKFLGEVIGKAGNADILLVKYKKKGITRTPFEMEVHLQIMKMGYVPMNFSLWNGYFELLDKLREKTGLPDIWPEQHWQAKLGDLLIDLREAREKKNIESMKRAIVSAERFLKAYKEAIPEKYVKMVVTNMRKLTPMEETET
jgi:hypothetical protein